MKNEVIFPPILIARIFGVSQIVWSKGKVTMLTNEGEITCKTTRETFLQWAELPIEELIGKVKEQAKITLK